MMKQQYNSKDIYEIFAAGFQAGYYKRVGSEHGLDTYIGKDEKGRFAFKLRGRYLPVRIFGSEVISVEQYKESDAYALLFAIDMHHGRDYLNRTMVFLPNLRSWDLLESFYS